jgi:hypothetical protein
LPFGHLKMNSPNGRITETMFWLREEAVMGLGKSD